MQRHEVVIIQNIWNNKCAYDGDDLIVYLLKDRWETS